MSKDNRLKDMLPNRSKKRYAKLYRDYLNNFLTIEKFSEYYNFSEKKSSWIISWGKKYHNQGF